MSRSSLPTGKTRSATDQVHDRPATAFVVHGRDVASRLVQDQVAQGLLAQHLVVDPDLISMSDRLYCRVRSRRRH